MTASDAIWLFPLLNRLTLPDVLIPKYRLAVVLPFTTALVVTDVMGQSVLGNVIIPDAVDVAPARCITLWLPQRSMVMPVSNVS